MSDFKNKSITVKGMELLSKALHGESLEFTRLAMGSGDFEGDIGSNEQLIQLRQSLPITKITRKGSQVTLSATLKIEDIITDFEWREIGVYAKGKDDVEVLYMYGYTTNSSYISKDSLNEKLINVTVLVTNATQVTATIDNSLVYLTAEVLEQHGSDSGTHQDIRDSVEKLKEEIKSIDISWGAIQGKPETFPVSQHNHSWGTITNKPTEFQPINHTHTKSQITDFPTSLPADGGNAATVGNIAPQDLSVYIGSNPSTSIINNPAHTQNYDCWVHDTQATAIGLPNAGNWHLNYKKHNHTDGYGTQIAMPYGKNEIYMRSATGKTWTEWEMVSGKVNKYYVPSNNIRETLISNTLDIQGTDRNNFLGKFKAKHNGIVRVNILLSYNLNSQVEIYAGAPLNTGQPNTDYGICLTGALGAKLSTKNLDNGGYLGKILKSGEGGVKSFDIEVQKDTYVAFVGYSYNGNNYSVKSMTISYDTIDF